MVHHNDTDGTTAGAILRRSLMRRGFAVENLPIERVHPVFLPAIHAPHRRLIIYADLGGQSADAISGHIGEGCRTVILDHHLPEIAGKFPRLIQVNPETFGISGDGECAGATTAWFFSLALDGENEDLSPLGLFSGAVGDHQMTQGRCQGPNGLALERAVARGALQPGGATAETPRIAFPVFREKTLRRGGPPDPFPGGERLLPRGRRLALAACMDGPDGRISAFSAEMAQIQRERFEREMGRITRETGMGRQGEIARTDVEDRFHPLGLKGDRALLRGPHRRRRGGGGEELCGRLSALPRVKIPISLVPLPGRRRRYPSA